MLAADAVSAIATSGSSSIDSSVVSLPTQSQKTPKTIVFVDANLDDVGRLTEAVTDDAELVLLDASKPIVDQMTNVIRGHQNIARIHVVTHGKAGELVLGDQSLNESTLAQHRDEVQSWSKSLSRDADILLYGCSTGQGQAGLALLQQLASLTGADVAASDNQTGSTGDANGFDRDWDLEVAVGAIEAPLFANRDSLERYQHSLDINITAVGETGEESFDLLIDGQRVQSFDAESSLRTFTYETSEAISVEQVRVAFTNDLYQPENNFDRNLTIDKIEIDGEVFESEDQATFSTGSWRPIEGVVPGFGRGDTLHTDGYFQYGGSVDDDTLLFGGDIWNLGDSSSDPSSAVYVDQANDDLIISGGSETVVWRSANLAAGQSYRLELTAGLFSDGDAPPAAVGVDFFDADRNEVSEIFLGVDVASDATQSIEFVVPDGTNEATVWAWVGESTNQSVTELTIDELTIDQVDSSDVTPPLVRLATQTDTIKEGEAPSFVIVYSDDAGLPESGEFPVRLVDRSQLIVTNPNGEIVPTVTFTGGETDVPGEVFELYGVDPSATSYPEGMYSVQIGSGFVADRSGNFAPAQDLGSFDVQLQVGPDNPEDVTPPTGQLNTTEVSLSDTNQEFTIEFNDSESPLRFYRDVGARVIVTGPSGDQVAAQGIAGGNSGESRLFELLRLIPDETGLQIGMYDVIVEEGYVIDDGDNVNPRLTLGTFNLIA